MNFTPNSVYRNCGNLFDEYNQSSEAWRMKKVVKKMIPSWPKRRSPSFASYVH